MQEITTSKRKLIAEGYSGKIYLTKIHSKEDKLQKVVIKKFNLNCRQHYKIEKEIFSQVNPHHLFPQIYFTNDEQYEICMEYCKGGTLLDFLQKCGRLEEELAFRYFKQILEALRHFKRYSICHRDIKLENILILRDDRRYLKIVDLSFCAKITKAQNKIDRRSFSDKVGTEGYQCPEMLNNQPYSGYEADIFSLGVVLFEMIHGKPPFFIASKKHCEFYSLFCDNRKQYWELFASLAPNKSPELIELIEQLLEANPDKRITLGKVFKSPWFIKMQKKLKEVSKDNMEETQIDFEHYKKVSLVYNKSNFLTFLSRVFQNNTLYNSLSKIKTQQKHEHIKNNDQDCNKIKNKIFENGFQNNGHQLNLEQQQNDPENQKTQEDLQIQTIMDQFPYNLNQTHNGKYSMNFKQTQYAENPTINKLKKEDSLKTMSLSPQKYRNPQQNLIGNILKKKVLYYEEENKNTLSDYDYNLDRRDRVNTESGSDKPQNIFQLIRQNCKEDIYLRMSYIQIFSKPVDMQAIKQKYTQKPKFPSYLNRILNNNNFAQLAGFNF